MPVSEAVMELVRILDETGFGALAGELLTEINLGRVEPERDGFPYQGKLEESGDEDLLPVRTPFAEHEQIGEAVRVLRLRLVEPVRALAEAERIAGKLSDAPPIRIRFIDSTGSGAEDREENSFEMAPGDDRLAQALDKLLGEIERAMQAGT